MWIQICNPNLCKSHTFWNTANIENWPNFAYADLMTKINEIGKIARNSFIVSFLRSEFKSATQIYVSPIYFEITANIEKLYLFSHSRTWWPKSMKSKKLPEILSYDNFWISEFKSATKIYVSPIYFELQVILRNYIFLHTRTWWPKSM